MVQLSRQRSRESYSTPKEFMRAVETRFGKPSFDLAATPSNAKANRYYTKRDNALAHDWTKLKGLLWLNPPYADISPWAKKCASTIFHTGGDLEGILFLVPAAVGSNWFRDHVWGHARVFFLNGRLTFDGERDPYPKDCLLAFFDPDVSSRDEARASTDVWNWRKDAG
jgi:phage N-6-adenine-methyltransferase